MNKLAIFVEGATELEFAVALILAIARANSVKIVARRISGGASARRQYQTIRTISDTDQNQHFVLVYDCGGDNTVKKRLIEEYDNLENAGYSKAICMRDVYPDFSIDEIPKLRRQLNYRVRTKPITVSFVLAVMEIEAWFISEHTHFEKIDQSLTLQLISSNLGIDPANDDLTGLENPANDLNKCYQLVSRSYSKRNRENTLSAIDYSEIYFNCIERFEDLKSLCTELNSFLGLE